MAQPKRFALSLLVSLALVPLAAALPPASEGRAADWWPDGRRPPFALVAPSSRDDARAVLLESAAFLSSAPLQDAALPHGLAGAPVAAGGMLIVQFASDVTPAERLVLLARHGAHAEAPLPRHAWLARVPGASVAALAATPGVTWIGRYHPAYKLAAALGQPRPDLDPAAGAGDPWQLDLVVALDGDAARVADLALARGATVLEVTPRVVRVSARARLAPALLAAIDDVIHVEETPQVGLLNDSARWVLQSGTPNASTIHAHGVRGSGEIVAIMDSGLDTKHCCFTAASKIADNRAWGGGMLGADCTTDHGTHVSGTVACGNGGNHDGLAPDARLIMQDIGKGGTDCFFGAIHPPSPLSGAWSDARTRGARIHTNSWGGGSNAYASDSQAIDSFMWQNQDFLILYAAGNSGPGVGTLGVYANAKNSVTVAASGNGTDDERLAWFSSEGPAGDGRMLPDVAAPGDPVSSAHNATGCGWTSMSGTSMATPGVAGAAALVRQYFREGWYPGGSPVAANAFAPSAALVKAMLLVSARDMSGSGTGGDRPNSAQGFGRVTLDDALYFAGDSDASRLFVLDDRNTATGFTTTAQSDVFTLQVGAPGPVKVMLAWTDAPGALGAAHALVNDLDLEVTLADGTVFFGNDHFSGGWSSLSGVAHDRLNNKEAVFLPLVPAGPLTVRVRAYALGDVALHAQDYALVAVGPLDPTCNMAPPAGVGDTVSARRAAANVTLGWADRTADHYVVWRGTTPNFYAPGLAPYASNVHDGDAATAGVQWTDAAAAGAANYFYLVASAGTCGAPVP